jgi:hypothetical protein
MFSKATARLSLALVDSCAGEPQGGDGRLIEDCNQRTSISSIPRGLVG